MPRRPAAVLVSLALASPLLLLATPAHAAPVSPVAKPYDFDGDGFPELVVGAPGLRVGPLKGAGGITVLPASKKGVSTAGVVLTQATAGVAGDPGIGVAFGSAFASADFDHDGYADLAVGAPYATDGTPGTVVVLFGSASGLTGSRSYTVARAGTSEPDGFGGALAAADLDGDGYADLAVGAPDLYGVDLPGEDYPAGGTVTVLRGGGSTFSTARSTVLHGVVEGNRYDRSFGSSVVAGDVDGDARPDLVVGSHGVRFDDGQGHTGYLSVCTSGAAGPSGCTQLGGYTTGTDAVAVGNVRGDERNEIVVGQPESSSEGENAGFVDTLTLSGSGSALTVKGSELRQSSKGVPGSDERDDEFGYAVALGDLDSDGYADLVVGSPGEAIGERVAAGRVTVVYGGKKGYRTSGNKAYDQNTKAVPGTAEAGDGFGAAVSLLDHDADGRLDLTVGAPGENDGSGAVTTLGGSGKSFTAKGSQTFGLGSLSYPTRSDASFGAALGR